MSVNINKTSENYLESEIPTQNKHTRFECELCGCYKFDDVVVNMGKSTNEIMMDYSIHTVLQFSPFYRIQFLYNESGIFLT